MIGRWVPDKETARLQQLEQTIRFYCRSNKDAPGLAWLSSRTLTQRCLFRGTTDTMTRVRQLADAGHLGRVTARGRGRGRGRTLYWLPSVKKWRVLEELRREDMPHTAIVQALAFFVRKERVASAENVTDQAQQRGLGLSTVNHVHEKGSPAAPARRSRAPSEPPRQASPRVTHTDSTPPSTRRLAKRGSALERLRQEQLEAALQRMRRHVVQDPEEPP